MLAIYEHAVALHNPSPRHAGVTFSVIEQAPNRQYVTTITAFLGGLTAQQRGFLVAIDALIERNGSSFSSSNEAAAAA